MHLTSRDASIHIAGHRGLVGSALVRAFEKAGYENVLLRTSSELDLRDQEATQDFYQEQQPDYVVLAAAKVGGILANDTYPADFLYDNLAIAQSVIHAAHETGVGRLIFLGSSCIYPKHAPQPMKEEHLLTDRLEPTNQWYAIAKIAGLKLCQAFHKQHGDDFFTLMPTNLYGPGDNFDLETSHVLPALMRKFHEAKNRDGADDPVTLWGSGKPKREFLYADDLADACLFVLQHPEERVREVAPDGTLNVGTGQDLSINELAEKIQQVVGSESEIRHDRDKPDGTPRKLLDVSRLRELGWEAHVSLEKGLQNLYDWYRENEESARKGKKQAREALGSRASTAA